MGKFFQDSFKDDDDLEDRDPLIKNSRLGDDFPPPPKFSPPRGNKNDGEDKNKKEE